jgi:hypothetical protein
MPSGTGGSVVETRAPDEAKWTCALEPGGPVERAVPRVIAEDQHSRHSDFYSPTSSRYRSDFLHLSLLLREPFTSTPENLFNNSMMREALHKPAEECL